MRALASLVATAALLLGSPVIAQSGEPVSPTEQIVGESLPGAFFMTPDGAGPFPAIILLGGSEGGDGTVRGKAPLFLAEGYAVLGLPYYSPAYFGQQPQFPGLPRAFHNIPIDKLEIARDWLHQQSSVGDQPVGVYGVSKGAEFALLGASLIDGFDAVAAIVPTDVVWEAWGPGTVEGESSSFSWRGEPLPFVPYIGMNEEIAKYATPEPNVRLRTPQDAGRHAYPARVEAARIKIEDIDEPVLVAGGDKDDVWASGEMSQYLAERRYAAGLPTISLVFPDAGHGLSGTGEQLTEGSFRYSEADLAAQREVWPATLAFFAEHLKSQ